MADSDCIIVHEQVVVPDAAVVEEMVALPGEKGDKGDPFTYDDFTPEQIADLQRPATEAAAVANQAAENANKATSDIKVLSDRLTAEEAKRESAESSRASAESERAEAEFQRETSFSQMQTTLEGLITDTRTATSNANTAAGNAENAATEANNSATLANEAADKANQAAESIENRFSGERTGRIYLKYNRTQQSYIMPVSIWAEEDYIYLVIWGEAILCLSWNGELIWEYILWSTTGKTITVKGDYLYQFGNNNGTIYKINRYTGKTELSNKNDTVSYYEQKNKIYNVNGTIYCFSAISKSLYTLNENTLELVDTGLYSGEISGCDINADFITICAQNKLMKFSTELKELSSFDYSEKVTLLKDKDVFIYSHECSKRYTFIQPHDSNHTWLASYSGTNFSDEYYLNTKFGRGTSVICLTRGDKINSRNIPQLLTDNLKTNARVNLLYKDDIAISNNGVCLAGFFLNRNFMCYLSTDYIKIEIL